MSAIAFRTEWMVYHLPTYELRGYGALMSCEGKRTPGDSWEVRRLAAHLMALSAVAFARGSSPSPGPTTRHVSLCTQGSSSPEARSTICSCRRSGTSSNTGSSGSSGMTISSGE